MIPLGHYELLDILVRHGVRFVIIGGHAVNFHGHVRTTEDLDLIWLREPASEAALVAALKATNACWISNEIDPTTGLEKLVPVTPEYVAITHLMVLVTDFGFLDLFDFVPGVPEASVRDVFDQSIPTGDHRYASLEWLRRMKQAANRPRDLADLENLS